MGNEFDKSNLLGVKKRSWFSRRLLFVLVFFLVFCVVSFYFCFVPSRLVISPETTFVTEYLTPEGLPDYLAAYLKMNNAQLQKPEDNGYRLVLEAFGPYSFDWFGMMKKIAWEDLPTSQYGEWYQDKWIPLCEVMSIDPTQKPKKYTSIEEFYYVVDGESEQDKQAKHDKSQKLEELKSKLWRAEGYPEFAELLDKSAEALDLFSFAAKKPVWAYYRPHAYSLKQNLKIGMNPMVLEHSDLSTLRMVCDDLAIRISRRLGENDAAGALDDVLTILRIARHCKNRYTNAEHRVAFYMETVGMKSLQMILTYGNLKSDQIHQLIKEFDSLPKHEDSFEKFVQFEKLVYLEAILIQPRKFSFLKGNMAYSDIADNCRKQSMYQSYTKILQELPVDFNYAAKRGLFRWRSLESAAKERDIRKRWKFVEKYCDEALVMCNQMYDLQVISLTPLIRIRSQVFADIVFNKYCYAYYFLSYTTWEKKIVTMHNLFYVSSALELYQHDNGNYPDSLDAIVPKYLGEIPIDPFSIDNKFTYKKTDTGYILYSFGTDKKDDGGDEKEGYGDIVVERKR
ncbi:MAG: type II secretion system protein GspG [Planctomycetaceae bacterium]|jgi:hypothetical protein|nr:type II secretion system protein GspG [Planctomycetaceae bacterium]